MCTVHGVTQGGGKQAKVGKLEFIGGNIPADLKKRFEAVAHRNERNVTRELRMALRAHVERHENDAELHDGQSNDGAA